MRKINIVAILIGVYIIAATAALICVIVWAVVSHPIAAIGTVAIAAAACVAVNVIARFRNKKEW